MTGSGDGAFCSDIDLREAQDMKGVDFELRFGTTCKIYKQIPLTDKPVITAINCIAVGSEFQTTLIFDQRVSY